MVLAYLKLTGQKLVDRGLLTEADKASQAKMSLPAALSPWLWLIGFAMLVSLSQQCLQRNGSTGAEGVIDGADQ